MNGEAPERNLEDLLGRYASMLRSAITKTASAHACIDVDDIEQEARIRVWKALKSGRKITNPTSYLYRVAVSATLDALRRVRTRREQALEVARSGCVIGGGEETTAQQGPTTPEEAASVSQVLARIRSCLASLSANRRRAVGLHLMGFTTQEVGVLLGWTEAKARNLVYRGLDDLRRCLRAKGVEYEAH